MVFFFLRVRWRISYFWGSDQGYPCRFFCTKYCWNAVDLVGPTGFETQAAYSSCSAKLLIDIKPCCIIINLINKHISYIASYEIMSTLGDFACLCIQSVSFWHSAQNRGLTHLLDRLTDRPLPGLFFPWEVRLVGLSIWQFTFYLITKSFRHKLWTLHLPLSLDKMHACV